MKYLIFAILVSSSSLFAKEKDTEKILGYWLSENGRAVINIYQNKELYFGKIVWLLVQHTGKVKIPLDINNDDKELKKRKLMGLDILTGFKFEDGEFSGGQVYDPKSGNTYKAYMKLESDNKIKLRGYIGISLFGRTSYWERQKSIIPDQYIEKAP